MVYIEIKSRKRIPKVSKNKWNTSIWSLLTFSKKLKTSTTIAKEPIIAAAKTA
jgi:hypothetical protein